MIRRALALASIAGLALSCASAGRTFAPQAPLAHDPDRRPFQGNLEPYYSPSEWDHLDNSIFRPISEFFAVEPGGEALNANALDEVPNSSWFENRVAALTPEGFARGPCRNPGLDERDTWQVVSSKPDGVYPGFVVEDASGQRYLIKLDAGLQGPHNSTADVVASRLYYAAGFDVPCNRVVHFDPSKLSLAPDAKAVREDGEEEPMTRAHVERMLAKAEPLADGRYRAASSRYLEGRPLGPWRYLGTRADDRNDIVPHQDRRELRGARVLAAWTGHWDSREQNSLAMWIETGDGRGFVRHHLLDFGDCFGAFAGRSASLIRRRGQVHWLDPQQVLADFMTFGLIERPWDRASLGPSGPVFGYYDIEHFDPDTWRPSYPNPAFGRMTERDAAWMARIIAQVDEADVRAAVTAAELPAALQEELVRLLLGRRHKILERYLTQLSPLARPQLEQTGGRSWLCADDLAVTAGIRAPRSYAARAWLGAERAAAPSPQVRTPSPGRVCAALPDAERSGTAVVLELAAGSARRPYPARFHLARSAHGRYLVVGLERPEAAAAD